MTEPKWPDKREIPPNLYSNEGAHRSGWAQGFNTCLDACKKAYDEAQTSHCKDCCCGRAWEALGVKEYTGKSISEHILELKKTQTSGLVPLENNGNTIGSILKSLSPEEYKALQNGHNIVIDMKRLFKFCSIMTSTFGTTPKDEVMSVEEIEGIIYNKRNNYDHTLSSVKELALAIHSKLKGNH